MCVIRYHETSTALNGMVMTIVAYRTTTDIDVEFSDGVIVRHRSYRAFLQGCIKHPEINPEAMCHRVGERRMAKWKSLHIGMHMTWMSDFPLKK